MRRNAQLKPRGIPCLHYFSDPPSTRFVLRQTSGKPLIVRRSCDKLEIDAGVSSCSVCTDDDGDLSGSPATINHIVRTTPAIRASINSRFASSGNKLSTFRRATEVGKSIVSDESNSILPPLSPSFFIGHPGHRGASCKISCRYTTLFRWPSLSFLIPRRHSAMSLPHVLCTRSDRDGSLGYMVRGRFQVNKPRYTSQSEFRR